ncbi:Phytanoyl-CoA dioxygenase family protein [Oopsacas minuta]|uniref:Phytanoyl-CoA dioxygenase family protein n=1 Tax=Oopsacas minuta TaxID=111878 RepID=A0AAV7JYT3_9METZ|nr:Phytanoyl-CoA dioxygenase family protein [Oopsacas minuta]
MTAQLESYTLECTDGPVGKRDKTSSTLPHNLLTEEEITRYHKTGYLVKNGLFTSEEMDVFFSTIKNDVIVTGRSHTRLDSEGFYSKLSLWNHPGINLYGAVARSARIIDNVETLLSGYSHGLSAEREEAYHYHSKVMIKEPKVGGAWEWHQDYGYWYNNGCLFPKMISVMVAIDTHTEENGCLQVLEGSHNMGRISHTLTGEQAGADMNRVEQSKSRFKKYPILCNPGDTLFLHCNTLHASAQNKSNYPRWSLICCYNTKSNNPYIPHHHPCYSPLDRWDDSAVLKFKGVGITEGDGTHFMDHEKDLSAKKSGLQ